MTQVTTTADQAKKAITRKIPDTTKTPAQIEDLLIRARVNMLIQAPFFGNLATRLILKDATEWCPTAATDGRYFYFNRHFVAALSDREVVFLMGHEVLHCVYYHMDPDRRGDRIPELWNIANDQVINLELVEAGIGDRITLVDICCDPKYRGMLSEEIYDDLYQEMDQQGRIRHVSFDMHLEGGGQPGEDQDNGENDGTKGPVRYTDAEREQIRQDMINATIQAAKSSGAGNMPGGVKRMLDKLLNPKINWRELLAQQIQSVVKANFTWMRPSRKSQDSGFYLPGMDREQTVDVAIGIDTSGSISIDMLRDMLSEVQGIMNQYTDYKVHIWCFDTQVHNPQIFTSDLNSDITEYEPAGFGGTDFEVNWEFMKDQGIQPKKFIMFTDGEPWRSWGDPDYADTIFIIHGNRDKIAPFGLTVHYETA